MTEAEKRIREALVWRESGGVMCVDVADVTALLADRDEREAALRAEVSELREWQRQMVEKAAANSLDGYRELGARAAAAENERDALRAEVEALRADAERLRKENVQLQIKLGRPVARSEV